MRHDKMKRRYIRHVCVILSFIMFLIVVDPVSATTISDLQKDLKKNQSQLDDVNKQISDFKGAQADIGDEISELDATIIDRKSVVYGRSFDGYQSDPGGD